MLSFRVSSPESVEVSKASPLTGKLHTMTLPIPEAQFRKYLYTQYTVNLQDVFPHLTTEEREFLITGIVPDEWDTLLRYEGSKQ